MLKLYKKLLMILMVFFSINTLRSEIIKNEDVNTQKFGIWTVSCKEDQMLDKVECKLFTEIDDQSIIFLNPLNKENMITIISKNIQNNSKMLVKVDKNQLFTSLEYKNNEFGNVDFSSKDKIDIFNNIKKGHSLFIRFFTIESKQITVKLNLESLQNALNHFNKKMSIIDENTSNTNNSNVKELKTKPTINKKNEKLKKAN